MSDSSDRPGKARGRHRPKKQDAPELDYVELDKLLVFGEVVAVGPDGAGGANVVYPSYRDLASRFGLSSSMVGEYAKTHNCLRRREVAKLRTQARVEEKIVERRAEAIAISKEEQIAIIDNYLAGFKEALAEGRVRYDSPADYNTMARLKEFLLGGSDPRHETQGLPSLERIQELHQEHLRVMNQTSPAERGHALAPAPADGTSAPSEGPAASDSAPPPSVEPPEE